MTSRWCSSHDQDFTVPYSNHVLSLKFWFGEYSKQAYPTVHSICNHCQLSCWAKRYTVAIVNGSTLNVEFRKYTWKVSCGRISFLYFLFSVRQCFWFIRLLLCNEIVLLKLFSMHGEDFHVKKLRSAFAVFAFTQRRQGERNFQKNI